MAPCGSRVRSFRLFNIAVSLYVYLFAFQVAGVHTYKALERHPRHHPPPLPELVQRARAAIDTVEKALGEDGPLPDAALQQQLDAADYTRVQRLRTLQTAAAGDPPRLELFDEAIHLTDILWKRGRKYTEGEQTERLGRTLVLLSAQSQWRLADAMQRAWDKEAYWSQGQRGREVQESGDADEPGDAP